MHINPLSGSSSSNSLNIPKNTLKIMFWNIQNLYAHGIMTEDEYKIETGIGVHPKTKKKTGSTAATVKMEKKNIKHMEKTIAGTPLTAHPDNFGAQARRREWVARTINDSGADLVIIAELAIGTKDIASNLNNKTVIAHNKTSLTDKRGNFYAVDCGGGSWGPEQLQIDLNKLFGLKGNPWHSALSAINASNDFTCKLSGEKIELKKGKNSMLEMYGLLWRSDKISLGAKPFDEIIKIVSVDKSGVLISFQERAPGHIEFYSPSNPSKKVFDLFCIHNLFGKETGSGAAERTRQNRGEGITNITKLNEFVPSQPTVVVGDFNLDSSDKKDLEFYKPFTSVLTRRIHGQKSSFTASGLVSEYDHIFTSADLGPVHKDDKVIDIAALYFGGDYSKALLISDHMPVVAVLTSDAFEPEKKHDFKEIITVSETEKYGHIKSENEIDSLFLAVANGDLHLTDKVKEIDLKNYAHILRGKVKMMLESKDFDIETEIGTLLVHHIQDMYEDAMEFATQKRPKHHSQWVFKEKDTQFVRGLQEVISNMINGDALDDAIGKTGIGLDNDYYDYISYTVMQALADSQNWTYFVNKSAKLPGIGPYLRAAFMADEPTIESAYMAYRIDIGKPGLMAGSYIEAHLLGIYLGRPVIIIELNEAGEIEKTVLGGGKLEPITLYQNGEKFDYLFGPL